RPASTASPRAPNVHSSPQSLPASTAPSTLRSKPATAAAVLRQLPPCPTSAFWIDQAHTRRLSPLAAELSVVGLGRTYGGHARPGRRSQIGRASCRERLEICEHDVRQIRHK